MYGKPIQLAVQALKLFMHSLPLGSKFNVYSFGTKFAKLFESSADYTEHTLKYAVKEITKFNADMNLTEILEPLNDIFE